MSERDELNWVRGLSASALSLCLLELERDPGLFTPRQRRWLLLEASDRLLLGGDRLDRLIAEATLGAIRGA